MKLSILCPTIRTDKLQKLYESIERSFHDTWEIIFVSPYEIPESMKDKLNVKWIQDWGNPLRCQQIALCNAQGEFIHRAVDDSVYLTNTLDNALSLIKDNNTIVNCRFIEGEGQTHRNMFSEEFYNMEYHVNTLATYTPYNFQIINFSIIPRAIMEEVGGWDCIFESVAFGELDLSLRFQFLGYKVLFSKETVVKCEWVPGEEGDHKPVHDACTADNAIYKRIYGSLEYESRLKVPLNNWANSPSRWERRFA